MPDTHTLLMEALRDIQPASALYLAQAVEALSTDGAGGELLLHIPRNPAKERIQVEWHGLTTRR